jgi:hypothetical protein
LYPNISGSVWRLNIKVRGTGAGTTATYRIYYYAVS